MIDLQNNDITQIKENDFKGLDKLYVRAIHNKQADSALSEQLLRVPAYGTCTGLFICLHRQKDNSNVLLVCALVVLLVSWIVVLAGMCLNGFP